MQSKPGSKSKWQSPGLSAPQIQHLAQSMLDHCHRCARVCNGRVLRCGSRLACICCTTTRVVVLSNTAYDSMHRTAYTYRYDEMDPSLFTSRKQAEANSARIRDEHAQQWLQREQKSCKRKRADTTQDIAQRLLQEGSLHTVAALKKLAKGQQQNGAQACSSDVPAKANPHHIAFWHDQRVRGAGRSMDTFEHTLRTMLPNFTAPDGMKRTKANYVEEIGKYLKQAALR